MNKTEIWMLIIFTVLLGAACYDIVQDLKQFTELIQLNKGDDSNE